MALGADWALLLITANPEEHTVREGTLLAFNYKDSQIIKTNVQSTMYPLD